MTSTRFLALFLCLLLVACGQARPELTPTAVSQTTPTATTLPTITAVPSTATFTPTPLPTLTTTPLPTVTSTPLPTPAGPGPTATPIRVSDKVGFELLAQVGGQINSFAVSGDLILVGQGPRLVVLDGSDPANLTPIGQSDPLSGLVSNLMVRDDTTSTEPAEVAVLTAGSLLMVWDVSDPTRPEMIHSLALPAAGMLLWQDDIIYAAGLIASQYVEEDGRSSQYFESYVATLDVSGPPRLLDQITVPYHIYTIALVGDVLYLGMGHQPAVGVDVTNPTQLSDPIPIPLDTEAIFSLQAYGDTLLVGGYYELAAFDVSDPRRPRSLWREEGSDLGQVYAFAAHGQQLYTTGWQAAGASIRAQATIDLPQPLSEPEVMTPVGIGTSLGHSLGLVVVGDTMYRLLSGPLMLGGGLHVLQLDYDEAVLLGAYRALTGGPAVIIDGIVYVGTESGTVYRYQLPDLTAIDWLSRRGAVDSLTGDNGRLYLTADNALHIYDAATLAPLGHYDSDQDEFRRFLFQREWRRFALPVVDNIVYAYARGFSTGQEMIIRLDVNSPDQIQSLPPIFLARDLHLEALAANERWLVASLSTSQPDADNFLVFYERATLTEIRARPLPLAPTTLWLQDDLLLAGGGGTFRDDGFLQLYQMPDGLSLTSRRMPGVYDVVMGENNLALVTTQTDRRLLVFDFTDPVLPQAVGAFDLPYHRGHLAVAGAYVLVSDPVMGLYLLRLER
jgi:hypothetical protein